MNLSYFETVLDSLMKLQYAKLITPYIVFLLIRKDAHVMVGESYQDTSAIAGADPATIAAASSAAASLRCFGVTKLTPGNNLSGSVRIGQIKGEKMQHAGGTNSSSP